jgi:hypothetical protein
VFGNGKQWPLKLLFCHCGYGEVGYSTLDLGKIGGSGLGKQWLYKPLFHCMVGMESAT